VLLETVALVPNQDPEPAEAGRPTWDIHQSRTEPRRSVGHVPQIGSPARFDQQMAEGSRSHICQRTVGETSLPGYGSVTLLNRPVRTRMPGGVGRGGEKPPLTRLYARHGRELMGCKSPVLESKHCRETGYIKY